MRTTSLVASCLALLFSILSAAAPAGAETYNVDRFDDSTANACTIFNGDDCGLRGAILRANSHAGVDLVVLDAGTYELTIAGSQENLGLTGDLDVTDTVTVVGLGPERTTIDANGIDRAIDLVTPGMHLVLRGLTVTGGADPDGFGGGIRALYGNLRLETCWIDDNSSTGAGGAIGGASLAPDERVEILDSWITGNLGGWSILDVRGLYFERSAVTSNVLTGAGYTVRIAGADAFLLHGTIASNAGTGAGSGAVQLTGTALTIDGFTIAGNFGDELVLATGSSGSIRNTAIVGTCGNDGILTTARGNLESPGHTCGFGAFDLEDVADPGLSALGFHGGPTPILRPMVGGPANDAPLANPGCGPADQRRLSRPRDGDGDGALVCDIGAAERAGIGEMLVDGFECGFTTGWSAAVH